MASIPPATGPPRAFRERGRGGAVVLVLVLLTISAVPIAGSRPLPPTAAPGHPQPGRALISIPNRGPSTGLAGASGVGRFIDGPALYRADGSFPGFAPATNVPNGAVSAATPAPPPTPGFRPHHGASRPSTPGGWVNGTVVDSVYGTPIPGVEVAITTPSGVCGNCTPNYVSTNTTGYFRVEGDPGLVVLTFTDSSYLQNRTYPTVVSGVITSVGAVNMVHLATVAGRVVEDLPGLPSAAGVNLSSQSRDGTLGGPAQVTTLANGSFSLSVDPIAIEIQVQPPGVPAGFFPNATYASPAPWSVVNVGTIELEGGVNATVRTLDSVTGAPVFASIEYCSDRIDNACLGPAVGSIATNGSPAGVTNFSAVYGPGYIVATAGGYVSNETQVPDVPVDPSGVVDLGTVELVPFGAVQVTVNFTGGTSNGTWPSSLPPGGGGLVLVACELSGSDTGSPTFGGLGIAPSCSDTSLSIGVTALVPVAPLRNILFLFRAYGEPTGFPVAELTHPGGQPWPPWPYRFLNVTWANVTPDHITNVGPLNLDAGTYLSGTVAISGSLANVTSAPVTVQVCSTVRAGECLPSVLTDSTGPLGSIPSGCPTAAYTFCAPAPPGPDELVASWGSIENSTWVTVPFGCCQQEGNPTDVGLLRLNVNVGAVHGTVGEEGQVAGVTPLGGWTGGVTVCPASGPTQCFNAGVNPNGTFSSLAALGWDVVSADVSGFRVNYTWIDVTANNSTGEIEVGAFDGYSGQLVSATTGLPILQGIVTVCNVNPVQPCYPSTTTSGSNGTYQGTLPSTGLPVGSVEVSATASGYDPESTFLNLTPGGLTVVPTIRLPPVGVSGGERTSLVARGANSSVPTTGSWVVGRVVDSRSGLGVGNAVLSVCLVVSTGGCSFTSAMTLSGGEFNLSTVHGAYEIWVNATHYGTGRVYLNASLAGTVSVGNVPLTELVWVAGRVLIDPWESLGSQLGEGADQVIVIACAGTSSCGPPEPTNSGGFFNVSAPAGTADSLSLSGGGPSGYGNALDGYNSSRLAIATTIPYTRYNGTGPGGSIELPILGGEAGYLSQMVGSGPRPAYFASYGVESSGPNPNLGTFVTGGGGYYVAFLPDGATNLQTSGSAGSLVPAISNTSARVLPAGAVLPGPNVSMAEFGFVTATIRTVGAHVPLSEIHFVATGSGGPTNQPLSGSSLSNGLGFVNVSAPPGNDSVTAGSTAYTNVTGFTIVASGATDPYGPISMTALAGDGLADVRSVFVNTVGVPPTPGTIDNITENPVLGLHVVEDTAGGVHGQAAFGSDLGQYFLSAVPADAANITFSALGFTSLTLHANLTAGLNIVVPELNMTANGILEGRVVADPGNISVPYANVVVCPTTQSTCLNHIQTNVSGVFWIGAPAGLDEVTVDSPLYLSNLTKLVNVSPDTFTDLGDVPVFTFGTVHGFVRSLPYGDLLANVNVSVCSKYSAPGSCLPDETVATDANGTFSIQSPPGTYFLYASTPGYNATRYLIEIAPGADLFVGTMFLQQYGEVVGEVVNATGVPVGGATVFPCPTYAGPCGASATTASDGSYRLWTSPGPTVLTASAPGYVDGALPVNVVSGSVVHAAPIVLTPIPPDVEENVSGIVTAAATGSGLPNALVVADENGGRVGQTVTGAGGAYRLQVRWGTVEVVVGAPNYRAENATVVVHANVTGVDFALAAMTYRVWGVTSDEGTRTILSGVQIENNGTTVARSDSNGRYQLQLPNGTTTLTASYTTNGTIQYGTVHFAVPVSGGSVEYNLALPRSEVPLRGVVVSASTGRPLTAASVTLWTPEGKGTGSRSTDRDGQFTFGAGPGTYNVSVTATGFEPTNQTVSTGEAGNFTTVSLEPVPTAKGAAGIPTVELAAILGGAVAVGAAAVVAIRSGRDRTPPADPEDELLPVYEPPT